MNNEFKILSVKKEISQENNYIHLIVEFTLTENGKIYAQPLMNGYYNASVIKDLELYEKNNRNFIEKILKKKNEKNFKIVKKRRSNCFYKGYMAGSGFINLSGDKKKYVFEEYLSFTNIVVGGIQDIENLMIGINPTNCDSEYLFVKILKSLSEHWD